MIDKIDEAIKKCDHRILLRCCRVSFANMFKKGSDVPDADNSPILNTPFRIPNLEAVLLSKHASAVHSYEKKVGTMPPTSAFLVSGCLGVANAHAWMISPTLLGG